MKRVVALLSLFIALACADNTEVRSDLTGKELSYPLYQTSQFEVSGTLVIQEKKDGLARLEVSLNGLTGSNLQLPVHLHFGGIDKADAVLAAQLNPIDIKSGKSITDLCQLLDETKIAYRDLEKFSGSVKIHLSETGEGRKVILAAGNIGSLYSAQTDLLSKPVAVCTSGPQ